MILTLDNLKRILHYQPSTGIFTRLVRTSNAIKIGETSNHPKKNEGYLVIRVCGKQYRAHRLAWFYMTGKWPTFEIDHKNRIKSDNRWGNIRDVPRMINIQNRMTSNSANVSTGLLGSYKQGNKFQSSIGAKGKQYYLGIYNDPLQAHYAYMKAKLILHPDAIIDATIEQRKNR